MKRIATIDPGAAVKAGKGLQPASAAVDRTAPDPQIAIDTAEAALEAARAAVKAQEATQ